MIIDAHTHIGKKTVVGTADELIKSMDEAGIAKSLVLAGKLNGQSTPQLIKDIDKYNKVESKEPRSTRLFGVGSVSPLDSSWEAPKDCPHFADFIYYLDDLLTSDCIVGLKFYTGYEHFYPYDDKLVRYLDLLVKADKPAIFHSGDCVNTACGAQLKYAHPIHIDELAVRMPDLKIIIAHCGYPWVLDAAQVCYKNKNVYADTSGFVYGAFQEKDVGNYRKLIEEFIRIAGGTEKLIFGSDWPISNQKSYVDTMSYVFNDLRISREECENIMGLRACKLFRLDEYV